MSKKDCEISADKYLQDISLIMKNLAYSKKSLLAKENIYPYLTITFLRKKIMLKLSTLQNDTHVEMHELNKSLEGQL